MPPLSARLSARRSHPAHPGEGSDAPPTLERSGSERRGGAVTSLALLERARAWEWVKDSLFARGGQGSRKCLYQKKDELILEKKTPNPLAFSQKTLIFAQ